MVIVTTVSSSLLLSCLYTAECMHLLILPQEWQNVHPGSSAGSSGLGTLHHSFTTGRSITDDWNAFDNCDNDGSTSYNVWTAATKLYVCTNFSNP